MSYKVLDPLAQSFFIEQPTILTKVDLYFSAKDSSLPVFVQIRKNQNGVPGPYVVPLSETIVYPSSILTSSNANVATSINFSNPIFLEEGEYSLTIGSDSSTYKLWVSELGEVDTTTSKRITEQPYVGSLFKSQNASTYTPVQTEDLKFKLYRAKFQPNVSSSVEFILSEDDRLKYLNKVLETNPLEVFPNSSTLRVHHSNHGMSEGSYVKLNGISNAVIFSNVYNNFYNINAAVLINTSYAISNVTLDTYTISLPNASTATVPTRFGGVSVVASQDLKYDTLYPVVSSVVRNGKALASYKGTSTAYAVDTTYTSLEYDDNELAASKVLTGDVTRENNLSGQRSFLFKLDLTTTDQYTAPLIDTKQLGMVFVENLVNNPTYDNLNIANDIVTISSSQVANVYALSSQIGLLSFSDSGDVSNARSIASGTRITLSGSNPNNGVYRVVDVIESGANVKIYKLSGNITSDINGSNSYTVTNGISFVDEEAASSGSAYSKYITRQIDFINESTSFNFRLDVCQPDPSFIEVYYKTKLVGENELLSNKEFVKIDNLTIPTSLAGEFYEVQTQIDGLQPFNAVILKVVFKSSNSAKVPKIKNLRLIALE